MVKIIQCPNCGESFDISYARVFACGSCPSRTLGNCGYCKCPKCNKEFPLDQ